MTEKSVEPLIAAARTMEISARNALGQQTPNLVAATATRHALQKQNLPLALRVSPRQMRGPRVERKRSHQRGLVATTLWPQDGLEATRFPILCGVLQGEATLPLADYCLQVPAENLVLIPAGVPHPDGSQPHLNGQSETDFCDLFWLYRWEGGLICHMCHSRGTVHANFQANENCFLIGEQSIFFFDLLVDAICSSQSSNAATPYILPALLAVVGEDLQAGHYVQPGVLPTGAHDATTTLNLAHEQQRQETKWKENFGAIMQAQNYIAFHLDEPLSIDDMAQMACMSRAQFTQLFRRATGKSFVQYLTCVRLESAKTFLCETDWNVEIVARAVGWRGAHLWKMFARELNTTPGEFRRIGNKAIQEKRSTRA